MRRKIVISALFGIVFCALAAFPSFASERIRAAANQVVYTFDAYDLEKGSSVYLFFTTCNATIELKGREEPNRYPSSSDNQPFEHNISRTMITSSVYDNPTYIAEEDGKSVAKPFATRVTYRYTLVDGHYKVIITIQNPAKELTGMYLALVEHDGNKTYYSQLNDITEIGYYVREAIVKGGGNPDEDEDDGNSTIGAGTGAGDNSNTDVGDNSGTGNGSGTGTGDSTGGNGNGSNQSGSDSGGNTRGGSSNGGFDAGGNTGGASGNSTGTSDLDDEEARHKAGVNELKDKINHVEPDARKISDSKIPCRKLKDYLASLNIDLN